MFVIVLNEKWVLNNTFQIIQCLILGYFHSQKSVDIFIKELRRKESDKFALSSYTKEYEKKILNS